ncbi:hypothetical protein XENOCAPTIV_003278 [Xenoophorus captivus]|uniref:PWWP domain-containing protein n=1 Tax=Xenoophorus captivus TaxID=1517983 RepID=A0ABV0R2D5_9TELE
MQGIMGNTIQQPPQLIDSANIRQDGSCDTGSDPGEDSGPSYDAALDAEFSYPPSASEDMPQVSNGYPPGLGLYEPQAKFSMYSQFPNGSANGYGAIRSYGEHGLLPGEGTVLRGPGAAQTREEEGEEEKEREVTKVHHPSVIQETGFCKEFVIGDLVWSKVGTYPWWPCMVSSDPQMKVHTRINTRGHREYHVQFFGSVAERAWIHEKRIVTYQGKQQFDELQAETLRKATNPLLKPIPQRERTQWEVGVGHAEDAFLMTRQERIDNYTFIYVDPEPDEAPPTKKPSIRAEKRNRRSSGSVGKKEDVRVKSPDREQPPRRQLPRRLCSVSNTEDSTNSQPAGEEKNQKKSSPKPNASSDAKQDSPPPPVRPWKTAAARKLLPLSITMKRLNVEITKCDWPLLQKNITPSPKKDKEEEKKERVEREARQPDLGYCSPDVGLTECRWMVEISRKV